MLACKPWSGQSLITYYKLAGCELAASHTHRSHSGADSFLLVKARKWRAGFKAPQTCRAPVCPGLPWILGGQPENTLQRGTPRHFLLPALCQERMPTSARHGRVLCPERKRPWSQPGCASLSQQAEPCHRTRPVAFSAEVAHSPLCAQPPGARAHRWGALWAPSPKERGAVGCVCKTVRDKQ